ncbi:GlcNAc-domain-containing protein [Pelagophyceae sp. CCMP2097]|nr:GlcNAc-domain-containing protein [Pelagophyceae sp. CCMP2097]
MGRDGCAFGDRHCSLMGPTKESPCVWVGPHDGKWVKVVDAEDVFKEAPRACAPRDEAADHSGSIIFAAIASYRDDLCATTLHGLFRRAKYPDRIQVGIVQQNAPGDADCVERYCELASNSTGVCPHLSQISVKKFDSTEAKGPTWARAQDSDMLPLEAEFCLRTDSHMAFATNWDELQIEQWYGASNEFAVLSTYVADAAQIRSDGSMVNVNGVWEVPHLCSVQWENGHVRNMQAKAARLLRKPKLTTLWAAGLSFSRCHAERAVPYDPLTPYIFWGEEFSRTARFFTHGYDVYTPPRTLVAHDYKHTQGDATHLKWNGRGGPSMNDPVVKMARDASNKRIWTLLGMPGGDPDPAATRALGAYGLGAERTLEQLVDFTAIRLSNRTTFGNRCGNIDWVPWDCAARRDALAGEADARRRRATALPAADAADPYAAAARDEAGEAVDGVVDLTHRVEEGRAADDEAEERFRLESMQNRPPPGGGEVPTAQGRVPDGAAAGAPRLRAPLDATRAATEGFVPRAPRSKPAVHDDASALWVGLTPVALVLALVCLGRICCSTARRKERKRQVSKVV